MIASVQVYFHIYGLFEQVPTEQQDSKGDTTVPSSFGIFTFPPPSVPPSLPSLRPSISPLPPSPSLPSLRHSLSPPSSLPPSLPPPSPLPPSLPPSLPFFLLPLPLPLPCPSSWMLLSSSPSLSVQLQYWCSCVSQLAVSSMSSSHSLLWSSVHN